LPSLFFFVFFLETACLLQLFTTTPTTITLAFSFFAAAPSSSSTYHRRHSKFSTACTPFKCRASLSSLSSSSSSQDDDDDDDADGIGETSSSNKNDEDDAMKILLQELRQRTQEINKEQQQTSRNWLQAKCVSRVGLICNDWVRRLDISASTWPLVAVGSASGNVFLGNLETSTILATSSSCLDESSLLRVTDDEATEKETTTLPGMDSIVRMLYGGYDGGGTMAIAYDGPRNLICESGRRGGVHIWRYHPDSARLISQGQIPLLQNTIVTALQIHHHPDSDDDKDDDEEDAMDDILDDHDYLWVATGDGRLLSFDLNNENISPLAMQTRATCEFDFLKSPILAFATCPQLHLAAVATASGAVHVVSTKLVDHHENNNNNNAAILASFTPPFDSSVRRSANSYPLCVTFVKTSPSGGDQSSSSSSTSWSVACGGNDGSIFVQQLNVVPNSPTGRVSLKESPLVSLLPRHLAPVKCLTAHPTMPGLLMSAGQDGTIRVWNVAASASSSSSSSPIQPSRQQQRPTDCLYQLMGYKVWLGSLWTDGRRLVTDGSDNTIIVHDFGAAAVQETK
jgi:WD40 repeat protein